MVYRFTQLNWLAFLVGIVALVPAAGVIANLFLSLWRCDGGIGCIGGAIGIVIITVVASGISYLIGNIGVSVYHLRRFSDKTRARIRKIVKYLVIFIVLVIFVICPIIDAVF